MFTDIVDSTKLTQRLGDDAAMDLIDLHDTIVRRALAESEGREVKHMGDGMLTSFVSAAGAVKCATLIQLDLAKRREAQADHPLHVRIGIASGEPVEHHSDIFGSTVQLAARLCSSATAGQILVSNVVAELCFGKKIPFQDQGELTLKGFDHPIRVHAVAWTRKMDA